jgi:LmbE family N-acetylglucosaminyl deacetylase
MDAVFFGSHPDDVELTSAGLAARLAAHGHQVAIVDLTRGEAASRGTVDERAREAEAAAGVLGVAARECPRAAGRRHRRHRSRAAVRGRYVLRRHTPALVVAPDADDDHPDHVESARSSPARATSRASRATAAAVVTVRCGCSMRSTALPRGRSSSWTSPTQWERRMRALDCHRSQLDPRDGPSRPI